MAASYNDISNEIRNILGSFVKSRTFSTPYRLNKVYSQSRKTLKRPKHGRFETKIFDFPDSAIYKMDEIDGKQLQEIGTGSIVLHEGDNENAVETEISNLIKSFNKEGTSIHESTITYFKCDGRRRKLRHHHHHPGSFSYDYFELKDLTTRDSKILYVVFYKILSTKTASTQSDKSIPSFSGYELDNYADFEEDFSLEPTLRDRNQRLQKNRSSRNLSSLEKVHKLRRYVVLANWNITSKCYIEFGNFVLKTLFCY